MQNLRINDIAVNQQLDQAALLQVTAGGWFSDVTSSVKRIGKKAAKCVVKGVYKRARKVTSPFGRRLPRFPLPW